MTRICNKKAQVTASMITLAVSTIVIAIMLVLFFFASTLFTIKHDIQRKAADFSSSSQAEKELLSLIKHEEGNLTVSDMARMSKSDSSYSEKLASLAVPRKISFEYMKNAEMIEIPDFISNIKLYYSLK